MSKKIIILLVSFFISSHTYSDESLVFNKSYHVKLISISHDNNLDTNEEYSSEPILLKLSNTISISKNNCKINYDIQCEDYDLHYKLKTFDVHKKTIQDSSAIRLIDHKEWVQEDNIKPNVIFRGGYDFSNDIFDDKIVVDNLEILTSGKIFEFEGTATIYKSDVFFVEIDMIQRKKFFDKNDSINKLQARKIYINQQITLNKSYYIDRESIGFILEVSDIK
tara:strand:- start:2381 stop:3046 length:666 start_codon:yes stop_codon:yes gene_type:complete